MSSSYPPPSSPPPSHRNNAWLAVIVGVLVVLVLIVGFGVFVISRFVHNTRIVTTGSGASQVTNIQSPLGDLHVQGGGNNARVSIESPFGDLKVLPRPDLAQMDMTVYPGAAQVLSGNDSVFDDHDDSMASIGMPQSVHFDSPGAEVTMRGGGGELMINVAEFRAPASTSAVLGFYQQQLGHMGTVQHRWDNGAQTLKLKFSDHNVRYVAVKQGPDGAHFLLVRVKGSSESR